VRRVAEGYRADYIVLWTRATNPYVLADRQSRPCLMHWALEVMRRMRKRGHSVVLTRAAGRWYRGD